MTTTAMHTRVLAVLLGLTLTAGCKDTASQPPSTTADADAPTLPVPGAPDAAGPPTVPADASSAPDGSLPDAALEARTVIRVHYAGLPGTLSLRGAHAPLSWATDTAFVDHDQQLYEWSSDSIEQELEFKPLLSGAWSIGPNYRVRPRQQVDIYPRFQSSRGQVTVRWPSFTSAKLPGARGIWVYLPPTYLENTAARFDTLYMHDAQNLFSAATAFGGQEWRVDETLDAGAADGSIREVVVIGVENTPERMAELTPSAAPSYPGSGQGDAYLDMIEQELKPRVDAELRTRPERQHTGLMGSSLGGLISVYAGIHRADSFGLIGAMSPSTWWDSGMLLQETSELGASGTRPLRIYLDSGDSGASNDDVVNTTALAQRWREQGYQDDIDLRHHVREGHSHNEQAWAARLPAALGWLLGPRPDRAE